MKETAAAEQDMTPSQDLRTRFRRLLDAHDGKYPASAAWREGVIEALVTLWPHPNGNILCLANPPPRCTGCQRHDAVYCSVCFVNSGLPRPSAVCPHGCSITGTAVCQHPTPSRDELLKLLKSMRCSMHPILPHEDCGLCNRFVNVLMEWANWKPTTPIWCPHIVWEKSDNYAAYWFRPYGDWTGTSIIDWKVCPICEARRPE